MSDLMEVTNKQGDAFMLLPKCDYTRLCAIEQDLEDKEDIIAALKSGANDEPLVKWWREYRGFSRAYMCRQTDISASALSKIESSKRQPTLLQAQALARALNLKLDDLF